MCEAILAGIISGIISSIMIYWVLFRIKPIVVISERISMDRISGTYRIKIVNRTKVNLMDVKYTLHYCHRYQDGIINMNPVVFCKPNVEFISPYSDYDENSEYAIRLEFAFKKEMLATKDDYLLFTLCAKHEKTGTVSFFSKEFRAEDILCGKFETGNSTKILVEQCGTSPIFCEQQCLTTK